MTTKSRRSVLWLIGVNLSLIVHLMTSATSAASTESVRDISSVTPVTPRDLDDGKLFDVEEHNSAKHIDEGRCMHLSLSFFLLFLNSFKVNKRWF